MSQLRHSGFDISPIYIARPVIETGALEELCQDLGLEMPPDPHVTVICSRQPVDWQAPAFAEVEDHVEISPQLARIERFGARGEFAALCLDVPEVEQRHERLRMSGASRDYADFRPHISLAVDWQGPLPEAVLLKRPIVLGPELRKMPEFLADLPQDIEPAF